MGGLLGAGIGLTGLLSIGGRQLSGPTLILAGVALSALSGALISLALTLAPNPFALAEITFWLLGGLEDRALSHVALAAPPIILGCALLLRLGPGLDALTLGEDTAASLGQPPARTLRLAAVGCALTAGASAAVAGGIGFVGLVVPHLLRPWLGQRPAALLLPSLLTGAILLTVADMLVRVAPLRPAGLRLPAAGRADSASGRAVPDPHRPPDDAMTGLDRFSLTLDCRQVLHDITLRPERGAMLALCGPNGAGKTSILRALAGLLPGAPASNPRQVAYLPQNAHAFLAADRGANRYTWSHSAS